MLISHFTDRDWVRCTTSYPRSRPLLVEECEILSTLSDLNQQAHSACQSPLNEDSRPLSRSRELDQANWVRYFRYFSAKQFTPVASLAPWLFCRERIVEYRSEDTDWPLYSCPLGRMCTVREWKVSAWGAINGWIATITHTLPSPNMLFPGRLLTNILANNAQNSKVDACTNS